MKSYIALFFAFTMFISCSSSDKKSTSPAQQTTEVDSTEQNLTIVAQPFSAEADTTQLNTYYGQLNYTGNEPFTTPALFVTGGKTYKLTADSTFMKETFSQLNGKTVVLYGKLKETNRSPLLEVHYYELREN